MRKTPALFLRDFDNNPKHVTRDVTPGCERVLAGQGTATREWDGAKFHAEAPTPATTPPVPTS